VCSGYPDRGVYGTLGDTCKGCWGRKTRKLSTRVLTAFGSVLLHCSTGIDEPATIGGIREVFNNGSDIYTIDSYMDVFVHVYDIMGREVGSYSNPGRMFIVDLSSQPSGAYFVSVIGVNKEVIENLKFYKKR